MVINHNNLMIVNHNHFKDFSMSMFLRQEWKDTRLMHNPQNNSEFLELDPSVTHKVWRPDLFIVNEKRSIFHDVTVPNKYMHIYPDGLVKYSIRISGTFGCPMDLQSYPLDSQQCYLRMESYGYSASTLSFRWNKTPVQKSPDLTLAQFKFGEVTTYQCDQDYNGVLYTCLRMHFNLTREYGFYMIQVYIPSILTVLLSWVSFWITAEATPARTTLGLVTVLTMATQGVGMMANLPRVSYIKAIDIWFGTCLLFVVAAFLEFAWVNTLSRVAKRKQPSSIETYNMDNLNEENEKGKKINNNIKKIKYLAKNDKARTVDKISRLTFPLLYAVFNAIYWIVYLV
ncbi:hypothetical protein KUTeg_024818 [Tegillarca granosa]|uniref:Uncharacterized protein n=1 Tax=Tegillarca granosa TaxID=220873 RepID=A0ABQ9E3Y0_TEGGR|nr:hypothetical protein KUTeg_024818 [Tegillarca granosa]